MNRRTLMTFALAGTASMIGTAHAQGLVQGAIDRFAGTGAGADAFVQIVSIGNNFEIESSRVLLARSTHPQIREFAQKMIEQHTALGVELAALPEASTRMSATLDESHTTKLITLRDQTDVDMLNRYYVQQQVEAHERAFIAYETFAENGEVPALRAFAQRHLPMIREHLAAARALQTARSE
jgi:putative membrane protein